MKLQSLLLSVALIGLSGCISLKSYVDPLYSTASFSDVSIAQDTNFDLTAELLTNGEPSARGTKTFVDVAEKVFAKAGITNSVDGTKLKITANNIADISEALGKGVGTGLTLGLSGTTVTDGYEFTFELENASSTTTKSYTHAIHSTVGSEEAPFANAESLTPLAAFEAVFEDVLITFLKDMNEADMIAWQGSLYPVSLAP